MQTIKSLFSMFLYALLCVPGSLAQVSQEPLARKATVQDVQIIIGQEQIRFTSQRAVQEMQLQVFNQAGEQDYDSGVSYGPTIDWPLQNPDGQPQRALCIYAVGEGAGRGKCPCAQGTFHCGSRERPRGRGQALGHQPGRERRRHRSDRGARREPHDRRCQRAGTRSKSGSIGGP